MNTQIIDQILQAASSAPSGDNVQPWYFEVVNESTRINIYNLPEKDNSYYNYRQVGSYIAHGAVIENIVIASRYLGYEAIIQLFPDDGNENHVAQVDLVVCEPVSDPLYQATFNRSTNRFYYKPHDISQENREKLVAAIGAIDNIDVSFVYEKNKIKKLAEVLMINDRLVFERKDIHGFLFDKVRWTREQITSTKDGMPVGVLGLNLLEKLFFPLLRFWWVVNTANYLGLSRVIGLKCWNNCRNASLLGFFTTRDLDRYGFIQTGRSMQRVWLEAARQGLDFQPIIGLPLLMYRLKMGVLSELSEKHQQSIIEAEHLLQEILNTDPSKTIVVGFRIGKGKPVLIKTLRKSVS